MSRYYRLSGVAEIVGSQSLGGKPTARSLAERLHPRRACRTSEQLTQQSTGRATTWRAKLGHVLWVLHTTSRAGYRHRYQLPCCGMSKYYRLSGVVENVGPWSLGGKPTARSLAERLHPRRACRASERLTQQSTGRATTWRMKLGDVFRVLHTTSRAGYRYR